MNPLSQQACGLFQGNVSHVRLHPKTHRFSYPYFCLWLNLDKLGQARRKQPSWFKPSWGICRFRPGNYSGDPTLPLADRIRTIANCQNHPNNQVWLLGQLSYWGTYFSPVNFFFIGSKDHLHTLVAEVSNTPWNEKHHYVIPLNGKTSSCYEHSKTFHVSPFMALEQNYRWQVRLQEQHINISITNRENGADIFSAGADLKQLPVNQWTLARVITSNLGWMFSTKLRIYWQALRLFGKGIKYVPYPGHTGNANR